jgi:hypothetical protein
MSYQREKKRKGEHHQSQSSKNVININIGKGGGGGGGGGGKRRKGGGGGGGGGGGFDPLAYNEAISMSMPRTNYVPIINTQQKDPIVVQPQVIQQDNKPSFWDIVQQGMGYGIAGRIAGGGGNTNNYYSAGQEQQPAIQQPKEYVKTNPVPPISGPSLPPRVPTRNFSITNAGGLPDETKGFVPEEKKGGFFSSLKSYFTRTPAPSTAPRTSRYSNRDYYPETEHESEIKTRDWIYPKRYVPPSEPDPVSSQQGVANMYVRPGEKEEKVDPLLAIKIKNSGLPVGIERAAAKVPTLGQPPTPYVTSDILGLQTPTFSLNPNRQTPNATIVSNDGSVVVGGSNAFKTPKGARVGTSPGGTRIRSDTDRRNNREENTPGTTPTLSPMLSALGESPPQRGVTKAATNAPKRFTKSDQSWIYSPAVTHSEFERVGESDNLLDSNDSKSFELEDNNNVKPRYSALARVFNPFLKMFNKLADSGERLTSFAKKTKGGYPNNRHYIAINDNNT